MTNRLFEVEIEEKGNPACRRTVRVLAPSMLKAAEKAVRVNPPGLWKPRAVAVKEIGAVL